ncbi:MAG: glycoside hydrolase family 3 N-terminal domain-containing protein, partial [Candidatus Heimdallarchaeota archaeon]
MKQRNRFLKKYPYYDSSLPLEQRIDLLLMRLTLKEKFKLLSGRVFSWWKSSSIYRLKIPSLNMSDGPHGISFHSSFRFMTKFPCSKCLSASWNPHLASNVGAAIAEEAKAIGKQLLLAPGMNIDRTPLNGRTFEYFSEDPFLTKEFAVAYVKG